MYNQGNNQRYKELVNRMKSGETKNIRREIEDFCENCQTSSPIVCAELCQLWKLKRDYPDVLEETEYEPPNLFNFTKNNKRLTILEVLVQNPTTIEEIREQLERRGHHHSRQALHDQYLLPLQKAGFIQKEETRYKITTLGLNIYTILTTNTIPASSVNIKEDDEKILTALLSGPKSYNELKFLLKKASIYRDLKRLQQKNLIFKSRLSGRIFYFKTKRRPTRKLSPIEMKIFKALPSEGSSVKDLYGKVGGSIRRIYKYLRRLRYKKHVKKGEKIVLYEMTDSGRKLARCLNQIMNLTQNENP